MAIQKITIERRQLAELVNALEDAIRYNHLQALDSGYDLKNLKMLHFRMTQRLYRAREMQNENHLSIAVQEGTDIGTAMTRDKVLERPKLSFKNSRK